ncbi:tetratricopeptide repeat protein [Suttonella ornithocola]|uniref:Polar organelle development protein n=1 Tax=Suttonella ornithocola TaxID=279832 RepID=A0A380MQ79_9GAMM|nr:tetratricopeptide repeat protein [Suttonella ornithocola]SUO94745.1 Polar organelle development protein [Suttonella ornithocola]
MKRMLFAAILGLGIASEALYAANPQAEMQAAATAYQKGNKVEAFKHLQNAAAAGDAIAQYNLSVAYSNGDGTKVNAKNALIWLKKSAQQGYPPAQYDLALYYLSQKQPTQAAPLLKILADKGDAAAQFNYGMMLIKGDGVKVNVTQGKQYISQAAKQGFPPAQQILPQLK